MAEWLKAHAWKACVRETVPWVRIPLSPPDRPSFSFAYLQTNSISEDNYIRNNALAFRLLRQPSLTFVLYRHIVRG
jgi:hypothetical protein